MINTVFRVVFLSILLLHFGVIRARTPYHPVMVFRLEAETAYFLSKNQFYNSEMQNMNVPRSEIRWYTSKTMTADNLHTRSVYIKNTITTPIQVSCSASNNKQIGTLSLEPGFNYFFRFNDHNWNSETYSCVATYTTMKTISFDAYKGKAPTAYQNGFEIREDGIYLFNGASYELFKGEKIVFLGIGSKLTNGFALRGNNDYRVIQFENRKNVDVYLFCYANDENSNVFPVGGTGYTVPEGDVYKFAIETGNFEKGFVECEVGAEDPIGVKVYGDNSFGQYKYGSEYYFINENLYSPITFETVVNFEKVENEITNTDPNRHLIQIQNQKSEETYIHCWGKQNQNSPQINVGRKDHLLQSRELYTFSIPVESFINAEFWCDIGGVYPKGRFVEIYGYEKIPRSNHFYAIRDKNIVYERFNGNFYLHY